ncbi:virion structural protein [Aeromonas phage D3]|uniref:Putative tail protein n=1 Tax=Aeromonas phage D3 TaxID=2593327 RepID=A0A514TVM8_9CAUD|nr:virion structural protein [Aeromonas phage D3]QDJ97079.1 putative tail protein [Aeromonas phage D3]QEP52385.1 hypothetical protein D9_0178 [Aeromonas phage D9]
MEVTGTEEKKLGSVIQLSPHGQSENVRMISQPEDGEPLVSLDDMYEVTGQEAITKLVRSCNEYFKKGRLAKESMTCLNLVGAESFVPMYDKYNARLGGESFVKGLKDGFVAVIKAIIKWIKALTAWIINGVKTLLGFNKTEHECAIASENADSITKNVSALLGSVFETGKDEYTAWVNDTAMVEGIPNNLGNRNTVKVIHAKTLSAEESLAKMVANTEVINQVDKLIADSRAREQKAASDYKVAIARLRRKAKEEKVTESDVAEFVEELERIVFQDIKFRELAKTSKDLISSLFDIEIKDLGYDANFKELKELTRNQIITTQVKTFDRQEAVFAKALAGIKKRTADASTRFLDTKAMTAFSEIADEDDAIFIRGVSEITGNGIMGDFATFKTRQRGYLELIETVTRVLASTKATMNSMVDYNSRLKAITAAYVVRDLEAIADYNKKISKENADILTQGGGSLFFDMDDTSVLKSYYPGLHVTDDLVLAIRNARELPKVKGAINNLLGSLGVGMRV